MKDNMEGPVITLKPWKLLCGVEKARLLHLLWIPHFHRMPITIFIIRHLLCLLHDGYLWLQEPIPITMDLIHRISQLPCKGKDPMMIAGKSDDLALAEAIKKKYKLEKKKRGYAINSIKDKGVCVATQLLDSKVMRKFRNDEVLVLVVVLAEQCAEGSSSTGLSSSVKNFCSTARRPRSRVRPSTTCGCSCTSY